MNKNDLKKNQLFANQAFQQQESLAAHFNIAMQHNYCSSIIKITSLNKDDEQKIEKLLYNNSVSTKLKLEQIQKDVDRIKQLTAEIRSIGRDGVLLMGERILQTKQILANYGFRVFSQWLNTVFGTKKTGYNFLSYFELYISLPTEELKKFFKNIPLRAAYVLSSKQGDWKTKVQIIQKYYKSSHNEFIKIVKSYFPKKRRNTKKIEDSKLQEFLQFVQLLNNFIEFPYMLTKKEKLLLLSIKDKIDKICKN